MSATNILISVGAQTAQAVTELNKINGALGDNMTTAEKWKQGFKKAGPAAAVAFAAVSGGFLAAAKGAEEAQKSTDALNQAFKSMGYEENAKAANDYADALERTTGIEAETIKAAQLKLATFTDVAKSADLMARATSAAADLSAAGFGEMSSVSNGLGKALQDPIKGMSLLTKQGSLTKAEQEKIAKAFEKTGDKAAAQDSILAALEKQVGGVAEASATNSEKMANAFGSISDAVGTALLPLFDSLTPKLQAFSDWASANPGVLLAIGAAIAVVAGAIVAINVAMTIWQAVASAVAIVNAILGTSFTVALGPVLLIIAAIAAVIAIGVLLYKNWDTISAWLKKTWESIKSTAISVWNGIKDWFSTTWNSIKTKAVELFEGIKNAVSEKIEAVLTFAKELPGKVLAAIGNVAKTLWQKGIDLIQGLINGYLSLWGSVLSFAGDIGIKVAKGIGNVGSALYEKGKSLIEGFINGIKSMAGKILDAILGILPSPVRGIISGALGLSRGADARIAQAGVGRSAGANSATFNFYGGASESDARVVKRALEGYDVTQGRYAGAPLRIAW